MQFDALEAEMAAQVASGLRPAIQVSIDWRGQRVFDHAVGDASADSTFVLWSATKPFVAVAMLALIDEGRAALDDRIAKFLPAFACRGKDRATIAHVLTHRGGFPDSRATERRELFRLARDWDAAVAWVCEMEAVWEPGSDRGYHPMSGWFALGEVVQRIADAPLAEIVRARVLEPCGIESAGFSFGSPDTLAEPPRPVTTRAERGAPTAGEAAFWSERATHEAVIPGAGGIGRAREVTKLYRAMLDRGRGANGMLLSRDMARAAVFPHVVGFRDRTFLRDIPWGLGFHLKGVRPALDDCGTRATPGTFGHGGHFLVNTAWGDPGRDLAVCILANGLSEPRAGMRAVTALSDAIHVAVDRASR